jgi:beta-1,4-mannosyl-glycoprotein beta-1,4-N-acetylglucosaminyltransferase
MSRAFFLSLFLCFFGLAEAKVYDSKVYDCFPFFNELELLKMRLYELNDVVDHFVLVEWVETHRGAPKPLYFMEHKDEFKPYLDKIIHIVIEERHPEMGVWERENFQRNCIARGLQNCSPSDIIIISDLDEIPRPDIIRLCAPQIISRNPDHVVIQKKQKKRKKPYKLSHLNPAAMGLALEQSIYYFQLNRQTKEGPLAWGGTPWVGTVFTNYAVFKKVGSAQPFRDKKDLLPRISNGGWHFSYMGGAVKVGQKILAVAEGHDWGANVTQEMVDLWCENHPKVPIDETFPIYIQINKDALKAKGYIAD